MHTGTNASADGGRNGRIDDFGEYIPGSRKEAAAQRLEEAIEQDPGMTGGISKSWPKPDWIKLAAAHAAAGKDPRILSTARALRDVLRENRFGKRLDAKLQKLFGPKAGIRQTGVIVLTGAVEPRTAFEYIQVEDRWRAGLCRDRELLYRYAGHRHDLRDFAFGEITEKDGSTTYMARDRDWKRDEFGRGPTRQAAALALAEALDETKAEEKGGGANPYAVTVRDDVYAVSRKHNGRWIVIRETGGDLVEAQRTADGERAALDAWWERWKRTPDTRRAVNARRTPAAPRTAADPGEFSGRFRVRGVQFGNWVEGARRRAELAETAQALEDLAAVLGWNEEYLAFGGRLGLAFGARGKGGRRGTKAHYESGQAVIAISKPAGAGCLAHEWFHGLDHHAAKAVGLAKRHGGAAMATDALPDAVKRYGEVPERLAAALQQFGAELMRTGMAERSAKLDERSSGKKDYWSTQHEMAARAFEAWVIQEAALRGVRNDYLVNVTDFGSWDGDPALGQEYPYPIPAEMEAISRSVKLIAGLGAEWAASGAETTADAAVGGPDWTPPPPVKLRRPRRRRD